MGRCRPGVQGEALVTRGRAGTDVQLDKPSHVVALHALVIGWGLVSFSTRAFDQHPEDSVPVDIVSADQFAKAMAGMKTGKKDNPKPLVEKVAEPTPPVEDAVGKIDDKKPPVVTEAAPPPKPVEKPVEKKPDPPKPVAQDKPKEEAKPAEKKPDPAKLDPIAEALKKDESKKPAPKPQPAKARRAAEKQRHACVRPVEDRGAPRHARSTRPPAPRRQHLPARSATAKGRAADNARPGARCSARARLLKTLWRLSSADRWSGCTTAESARHAGIEAVPLPGGSSRISRRAGERHARHGATLQPPARSSRMVILVPAVPKSQPPRCRLLRE